MPVASPSLHVRNVATLCLFISGYYPLSSGHADVPECPEGFFRNALLVFPCNSEGVERSYVATAIVTANQTEIAGTIPRDVKSLVIATNAPIPVWLALFKADAADPDNPSIAQGIGHKNLLGYDGEGVSEFTFYDITVSTEMAMGDATSDRPYKERITFFGSPPKDLIAAMKYNSSIQSETRVALAYRYDGFVDSKCTRPVGCAPYHPLQTAAILTKFSTWIDAHYHGFDMQAFSDLNVKNLLEKTGFLHFHDWPKLWAKWPSGDKYPWHASFNLVDSLVNRDGLVSQAELEKAFSFHRVYPSLSTWSGILHGARHGQTADQAWKSIKDGDDGLSMAAWKSEWELWPAPKGLEKVSGDRSFDYIDDDDDGQISQDEFRVAYDVFYMGHPVSLEEIHARSAALTASPSVLPRVTVTDIAAQSPSFSARPINTESETKTSNTMSGSTPAASRDSADTSSGDIGAGSAALILASVIAVAILITLCVQLINRVRHKRLLPKQIKHHGLSVGPSESRLSRELRAHRDPAQYEPVMVNGDQSMEAVPPPTPEWQHGQQDPLMHEVTRLQMALHQNAAIPGTQQFPQSPTDSMGTFASPMSPSLMHSYAAMPGHAAQHCMPHFTAQPSPQHWDASRGHAFAHYPQPQWHSSSPNHPHVLY